MTDNFKPGDVAICVTKRTFVCGRGVVHRGDRAPKIGQAVRVVAVRRCDDAFCGCLTIYGNGFAGLAVRFRKIDAPRTEIADRIRACKPIKVSA